MIDFRPVAIEDKDILNQFLAKNTFRNCDFSFSNIFCWVPKYRSTYAIESGFLFFRFYAEGGNAGYMYPVGDGDLKVAVERLIADSEERNEPFRMYALTREMFNNLEALFPGKFDYQSDRSWFEYIYNANDLITLKGKKLQAKRNHINQFKRRYRYEYLPITERIIPECMDLYDRWLAENSDYLENQSLVEERSALERAFAHFDQLGLIGGALRVDNVIVAYSYGQQLSADTFGIHAEKSLYEINGGFSLINQQYAEHVCSGYAYINREEDLGLESLRQAKMSYQPAFLLEKGSITLNKTRLYLFVEHD